METMRVKRIFTKKWSSLSFWLWITTSQKVVTKIIMQLVHWNKKGNIIHVGCFSTSIVGEGNGTPLQYSCLENPTDGGAWWAAVHGVATSWTQLNDFTFTFYFHALEEEMATHSRILAWRIPGTGSLVGCRLWGRTESDTTEWLGSSCHSSKHTGLVFCYYWDCFVYSTLNS